MVRLWQRPSTTILPLVLLGVMAVAFSCAPVEAGPRAWIDWPTNGFETSVGTTLTVIAHAYAKDGVGEVQLAVDRQPYRVVAPRQVGEQFVEISADWLADEPGTYLLSVTAFDMNGQASNPADVTVTVTGDAPQLIVTPGAPTNTPTSTGVPTDTPTSTGVPTGTPTSTATSTATTPPRPTIVSYGANPASIEAGKCTTLSWAVEGHIHTVYFDGEGVGDHDSRQRCPDGTTTYTLRAVGPGGEATATASVSVTEPPAPDTEGPPAPGGLSPTGAAEVGCGPVILSWNPVSDPSGVVTYYVKVEKTTGTPKSGGWTSTGTKLTIPASWLECGQGYRWAVRAEDGAGNIGPWSGWGSFVVELT